jgi:hypothetical protein
MDQQTQVSDTAQRQHHFQRWVWKNATTMASLKGDILNKTTKMKSKILFYYFCRMFNMHSQSTKEDASKKALQTHKSDV